MRIIELADHIQATDRPGDLVPALRRVMPILQSGDTLRFPEGEHDLYQEAAEQTLLPVTNHDVCARVHGILLRDKADITINGNGCTLFAHGLVTPIWIQHCSNVTVRNLTFDRREYLNGSGTVTAAGSDWMELQLDSHVNPDWFVWGGILTFQSQYWRETLRSLFEWDAEERIPARGSADNCGGDWQVQWHVDQLGEDRIRVSGKMAHPPKPGNQVMLRCGRRYAPGVSMSHSDGLLFDKVTVHACGGMAFIGQRCRDVTLRHCTVASSPRHERVEADCFDATHFSNCAGRILIENCRFENQLDDATNIHGAYFPVVRKLDAHSLRVSLAHPQQAGAPVGEAGDRFELCRKGTAEAYWSSRAAAVEPLNLRTVDVRFADALPAEVSQGDGLDNIDWYPDFTMRGCSMRGNRARATLISTRGKVLIEDNYFHSPGSAVQMSGGIGQWHESGPVHDCVIRGNHFDRCAYNAPVWGTALFQFKGEHLDVAGRSTPYHRNIRIVDNRITCANDRILDLASVGNLVFRDNRIERSGDHAPGAWHKEECCEDIEIQAPEELA